MSEHAVVHFEIHGPDAKALAAFYEELFGWTIDANNPMNYAMVFKMDEGIGGGIAMNPDGSPSVTFYVTCGDDVKGMLDEAVRAGAQVAMDVMVIPDGPTIAAFRDPDGNLIGLVNGGPGDESPVHGGGAPVTWFEIGAVDAAKSQKWFADLFGWKVDADNPMHYGMVDAIGNGIGGGIGPSEQGPYVTVYVAAADIEATLEKANGLGGKTVTEPMEVPGGPTIAHFTDPAGNFIGILLPQQ